jgi:hypothetical protein
MFPKVLSLYQLFLSYGWHVDWDFTNTLNILFLKFQIEFLSIVFIGQIDNLSSFKNLHGNLENYENNNSRSLSNLIHIYLFI